VRLGYDFEVPAQTMQNCLDAHSETSLQQEQLRKRNEAPLRPDFLSQCIGGKQERSAKPKSGRFLIERVSSNLQKYMP
jgi:hypothetical protein